MPLSFDSRPAAAPGVVGQIVADEAVIVLPDRSEIKVFNEVAAHIWLLCDGKRTVREIAAAVCASYAIDLAQAEQDTHDFISDLVQRHILTIAE